MFLKNVILHIIYIKSYSCNTLNRLNWSRNDSFWNQISELKAPEHLKLANKKAFWTSSNYKNVPDIWSPPSCKNARTLFSPSLLLLICDSYMSWSTRLFSLNMFVGFSIFDLVSFLLKFKFLFNKIHGL